VTPELRFGITENRRFYGSCDVIAEGRPAYYSALANADAKAGDLTEWLEYFLFGIAVEISRVEKTVLKLSSDRSTKEKYGQIGLNTRQIKAIEYLRMKGKITNKEFQDVCDVSASTAKRDLQGLVEKKVLRQVGEKGQSIYYVLNF